MLNLFTEFDLKILLYVQENLRTESITLLMQQVTSLGSIFLVLIVFWLIAKGSHDERLVGITAVVSVVIEVAVVNGLLKNIIVRPRPYVFSNDIIPAIDILSEYSFLSGHTALAFAMAFVLNRFLPKKYGVLAICIASLVGVSRVYLGVHYLSDVIGGIVVAYVAVKFAERIVSFSPYTHI